MDLLIFKTNLYLSMVNTLIYSSGYSIQKADSSKAVKINSAGNDSTQYELIVFEPGYESYLISQPSMEYYSESYYKTWNTLYVSEWNTRFTSNAFSGLYENYIDYDPKIEYGIKLEYQLYYFFRYFEKTNNVVLIPRGK